MFFLFLSSLIGCLVILDLWLNVNEFNLVMDFWFLLELFSKEFEILDFLFLLELFVEEVEILKFVLFGFLFLLVWLDDVFESVLFLLKYCDVLIGGI